MAHSFSVFANSCVKVPIDPVSKMPRTSLERRKKTFTEQCSIDSTSTVCSATPIDIDAEKLKDFYRSIPDYNEVHHLPPDEFYSTLKILREKRKLMLGYAVEPINDTNRGSSSNDLLFKLDDEKPLPLIDNKRDNTKEIVQTIYSMDRINSDTNKNKDEKDTNKKLSEKVIATGAKVIAIKRESRKTNFTSPKLKSNEHLEKSCIIKSDTKPRRNHSACSISWNDNKIECKDEIDQKFDQYFDGKIYNKKYNDDEFRVRSMPSSPLRQKVLGSPLRRRKSITIPKPFKMTERDEDERIVNELRSIRKSFSDDILHRKRERKRFRARPVPIESRIPLYDKIMEDQAMRRAITKINSEADLRAQMNPFKFTNREEDSLQPTICHRAAQLTPKPKKKRRFRARPVPKNLFSNYVFDKVKEDDFFRSFNRRIRAEEMLRNSSLPGSMATRDRSRLSTPAAHSDLPIDPSPQVPSVTSTDRQRARNSAKDNRKQGKNSRQEFITTSPQPFHLSTADRAAKKMEELTRKIYSESKSTPSLGGSGLAGDSRLHSALNLRASTRSNLAALLRAESVKNKFEIAAVRKLEEHRRKVEMKTRDRLLRSSNPAWHLVKNNYKEDIALRLQTRRDEERMRREEFLHEMELMYGRVRQQPMLFERYYAPRPHASLVDSVQLSPRKTRRKSSSKSYHFNSPDRSRKVSINDPTVYNDGGELNYLERDEVKLYSDSEALDSLEDK